MADIKDEPKKTSEELEREYMDVFKDAENGAPDNISQKGCLALAELGKDVWNAWREKYPVLRASAVTLNHAQLRNTSFSNPVDFTGFIFGDDASFENTEFCDEVSFADTQFGRNANFLAAKFCGITTFEKASFRYLAVFEAAQFGSLTTFDHALFCGPVNFESAQFSNSASFTNVQFSEYVDFSGTGWSKTVQWYSRKAGNRKHWAELLDMHPARFSTINFGGCKFKGPVKFNNREFSQKTSFSLEGAQPITTFAEAPEFHNCKLHQDTSFDLEGFPEVEGSIRAMRAYRTLKLAFAQQQATREEQFFFRKEMEEETALMKKRICAPPIDPEGSPITSIVGKLLAWLQKASPIASWLLMKSYGMFSGYGFSITRPLLTLFVLYLLGLSLNFVAGNLAPEQSPMNLAPEQSPVKLTLIQSAQLSLLNTIPGIEGWAKSFGSGLDNLKLGPIIFFFSVLQKVISLLLIFLIGLALRNRFKMK